jgi:hypothetical protein
LSCVRKIPILGLVHTPADDLPDILYFIVRHFIGLPFVSMTSSGFSCDTILCDTAMVYTMYVKPTNGASPRGYHCNYLARRDKFHSGISKILRAHGYVQYRWLMRFLRDTVRLPWRMLTRMYRLVRIIRSTWIADGGAFSHANDACLLSLWESLLKVRVCTLGANAPRIFGKVKECCSAGKWNGCGKCNCFRKIHGPTRVQVAQSVVRVVPQLTAA